MELLYNKGSRVDRNLRGDYSQGKHTCEMTAAMDSRKTIPIKHSSKEQQPSTVPPWLQQFGVSSEQGF